jgi:protein TonB
MNQVSSLLSKIFRPLKVLYNKAFDANKYAAGIGLSVLITSGLFFIMVILISLGDSGMKEDKSIKLADVVMPERQIDTFMTEVDKPEKPEEQPEDIAQPELDLQPLTGIDVSMAKPKANFKASGSFFRDGEYIPLFKVQPIYPRRALERGTQGYAITSFTITESGTVEDAVA